MKEEIYAEIEKLLSQRGVTIAHDSLLQRALMKLMALVPDDE